MSLYRLVYYSVNRLNGASDDLRPDIDRILKASRRNNSLVGVTGALMFSRGYFGQVLEGPQEAVEATFERIQQDARHGDVSLLEFAPIESRAFATWAMASVGEQSDAFADIGLKTGFDAGLVSGERLFSKLRMLVEQTALAA